MHPLETNTWSIGFWLAVIAGTLIVLGVFSIFVLQDSLFKIRDVINSQTAVIQSFLDSKMLENIKMPPVSDKLEVAPKQ